MVTSRKWCLESHRTVKKNDAIDGKVQVDDWHERHGNGGAANKTGGCTLCRILHFPCSLVCTPPGLTKERAEQRTSNMGHPV